MIWRCLKTDPPPKQDRPVVLFPCISDVGLLYDISNTEYARIHGIERGYTHWADIEPHPKEAEMDAKCEEVRNLDYQDRAPWHRGFHRAAGNIAEFVKKSHPDLAKEIWEKYSIFDEEGQP